jgi:probable HAF family extracellular repeat protein
VECLEDRCLPSGYAITDLGTLGGSSSSGNGVNAAGQVAGGSLTGQQHNATFIRPPGSLKSGPVNESYYVKDAFFWTAPSNKTGGMTNLGKLGGYDGSVGQGINDQDQVAGSLMRAVGTSFGAFLSPAHACIWQNGKPQDLGVLSGEPASEGLGINNAGQVVGDSDGHAFLWTAGGANGDPTNPQMLPLGIDGEAVGINNATSVQVVGVIFNGGPSGTNYRAFVWQNGVTQDLGTLTGGLDSAAAAINDSGWIVGWSDNSAGDSHAFLDIAGTMQDLGTLGGTGSGAYGINGSGLVVGSSDTAASGLHAFIYTSGTMQDLNGLIPAGSGWVLESANGINTSGQITGYGVINGQTHAFLLTPTTTVALAPLVIAPRPSAPQPVAPPVPTGFLTASPDPVAGAGNLTLTASNVADTNPGADIPPVASYLDTGGYRGVAGQGMDGGASFGAAGGVVCLDLFAVVHLSGNTAAIDPDIDGTYILT